MDTYKKHPKGFAIIGYLPQVMLREYSQACEYCYVDISEFGEIPITRIAISSFNSSIGKPDEGGGVCISYLPPLQEYARGFIDGYNSTFEPFINTIEAKKEMVLNSATKTSRSFVESYTENGKHGKGFELDNLYEDGFYEGERYKAWEIILQTPNEFIGYFNSNQQSTPNNDIKPTQTTGEVPPQMDAKTFFERRAVDNAELKEAIPELLKVIEDLHPLQKSEKQTDEYINTWRKTKYRDRTNIKLPTGETVEADINDPDMSIHDTFIDWLFDYFRKLYDDRTGKTIGYAFALDTLTVYHNQQVLNKRAVGQAIDRPNTNIDDVCDAINAEDNIDTSTNKNQQGTTLTIEEYPKESEIMNSNKSDIKQAREYLKYISHSDIIELVKAINKNQLDGDKIKQLLSDCLKRQFDGLPLQNDTLKKEVFNTFCLMVKNAETHIILYGIISINGSTPKPTIPKINTIAKIFVDEWMQPVAPTSTETPQPQTTNILEQSDNVKPKQQIGSFVDCLHHSNKEALMGKLHELIDGKQAKNIAVTIQALINLSILANYGSKRGLYGMMRTEFDFNCTDSGINKFLNSNNYLICNADTHQIEGILLGIK